ncbi:hypothetical protein WUBG_00461 [Wuchereria bancrofti]|uniref:E2F-associated phosphoprotein n=1 Tax=Wuchereria bancrofti TaxID=6293 RepID=J9BM77_WUCBA|nr:hypothetical protein WUBG_00461 [Wuchereria bancrofti]
MGSERLEPLETLEKDYYLDERNDWYSEGEQRDSESSDDELREQLWELAGMRCDSEEGKQQGKVKKWDEFEADMNSELSENFVAHASKIFSLLKEGNARKLENVSPSTSNNNFSNNFAKSVTFEDQLDKLTDFERSSKSSSDNSNLLYKTSDKATKKAKNEAVEFYDSDEDEDNECWVRHHREQLKIVKSLNSFSNEDSGTKQKRDQDHVTDAVLSCPACMSLLTRDCQRHELYLNQYRAIFVENCSVVKNEVLFLPQSGKKQKARKNVAGIKPNAVVDPADSITLPKEDLFHPVLCSICTTNVGVYDYEEIPFASTQVIHAVLNGSCSAGDSNIQKYIILDEKLKYAPSYFYEMQPLTLGGVLS